MKINRRNLTLAIAKSCMTAREIQKAGRLSCTTLARAKNDCGYKPTTVTVGKIARALGVSVEYLTEEAVR